MNFWENWSFCLPGLTSQLMKLIPDFMERRIVYLAAFSFLFICISCKNRRQIAVDSRSIGVPDLRTELAHQIDEHKFYSYRELWGLFPKTDVVDGDKIWDMYAFDETSDPENQPYTYTVLQDQCGNYRVEGDCYNREHSFPKSWWGRAKDTMYSDLFHIYPTDGKVNNIRGNFPFGETENPEIVSQNGSKLGPSSSPGYSGTVFEPIDAYKGRYGKNLFLYAYALCSSD